MSDSESTNASGGDGNNEREPPSTIIEALLYLCISDELSITTLHETVNNPELSPIYNGIYDNKYDPDKTLFVVHHACDNKNVTLEIIQFLLQNSIKCFPDAAQTSCTEFAKYDVIKSNEANQYKIWTSWFKKGQTDGSMIYGNADEYRNFLFGSLFYLHRWYEITDNESYAHIQSFIEKMIDRMYSTQFQKLQ